MDAETRSKLQKALAIAEELKKRGNAVRAASDFEFFAHSHLKIRTKSGALEALTLNAPQLYLKKRLDEQLDATGKVRALILKGRQQGASTFIGARFYHKVKHSTGAYCFILTHEQKATDNLFNMVDRYWRNDPAKPKASAANAKELVFTETDSGYGVGTAGAKSVGRSQTLQFFHGCLTPDTFVVDSWERLRPMSSFVVGDIIRTHRGNLAPISYISRQKKNVFSVRVRGISDSIKSSAEHRFWTRSGWKELADIGVGEEVGFPVEAVSCEPISWKFRLPNAIRPQGGGTPETGPDFVFPTYALGRVLGLYLAEGCVKRNANKNFAGISIAVHERDVKRATKWLDEVSSLYRSYKIRPREGSKTVTIDVYGRSFGTFVESICGQLDTKRFPDGWRRCGSDFVRGVLHGYISSDGHCVSSKLTRRIRITSIRPALAVATRDALAALGYGWAGIDRKPAAVRSGRNEREAWILSLCGAGCDDLARECGWEVEPRRGKPRRPSLIVEDGFGWAPITAISPIGMMEVMDFEVDHEDHSYCTWHAATHNSEVAFWPNASGHFASVVQAVPDLPGTEIILESTANGIGGEFHERWQQAEAGDGDYQAIFIPWFWSAEYARPVPPDFAPSDEEAEYQTLHGLTLEQIVWMRAKRAELKDPMLFMQEYPATAAEAFQTTGHDSFIKTEHVLTARKAKIEGVGPLVIGADPARFGDDTFSLAWRRGREVEKVERKHKLDAVQGAHWIKQVIDDDAPERVFVDAGGIGGPVVDILRSWGAPYDKIVVAVDFGSAPTQPPRYGSDGRQLPGPKNRRAEMWALSRDWLADEAGASIPDDDALHADACAPGYRYDLHQKLVLESKEDIRKRGLRSPDGWDAVALTFAAPVRMKAEDSGRPRYGRSSGRKRSAWAA